MAGPIKVLHVDDEPDFADMVAEFLERNDNRLSVESVTDPEAALDQLDDEDFDCVISDYEMPQCDGIDFLESVRKVHPELPFILFTGKGSEEVASRAISVGATDYIQKQAGGSQYDVLTNRILNVVAKYRAERTAEDTRAWYQRLIEESFDFIVTVDSEGRYKYASPAAKRELGYSQADLIGENAFEYIHEDDRDTAMERFFEMVENPDLRPEIEFRFKQKDGAWRWLEARGRNLLDDPIIGGIVVYAHDVTDRKERERDLRRYKTLVESVGDPMFMLDSDENIETVNEAMTDYLGASADQLEAMHAREVVAEGDFERGRELIQEILAENDRSWGTCEITVEPRSGNSFPAEVNLGPILDEDGDYRGCTGVVRDITDRKEREQKLEAIHERMEFALRSTDAVVWNWDIDKDEATFYPSEQDLYGTDVETWDDFLEVVHPDDRETVQQSIEKALETGEPKYEEVRIVRDGEIRWIEAPGRPILDDDGPDRMLGVAHDITDRKERERHLQRERDRLDKFAGVVSHDLRNPLNVARGQLELARDDCESEHLDTVDQAHDRIENLIKDLLSLARAGEAMGETEVVELSALAENCWQNVKADSAKLRVEAEISIQADKARLHQLLENLLRNAIEHGRDDVLVTIGDLAGGFYVEDDGPGFPDDDRSKLLDPGYTTSETGTGFGLSIVRDIADAHGWDVTLSESKSGGARVEFSNVQNK